MPCRRRMGHGRASLGLRCGAAECFQAVCAIGLRFRRRHSHRCEAPSFRPDTAEEPRRRKTDAGDIWHEAEDWSGSLSNHIEDSSGLGFLFRGRGRDQWDQSSSSAKWISTRRFDAFAEPSVSSATLRDPARPTQLRRARSMPRATKASATADARPSEKATAPPFSPPKCF